MSKRFARIGFSTAAALILGSAATMVTAAPAGRISAPAVVRRSAPRQTLNPLGRAGFKRPDGDDMAQIYAELRRKPGWGEVQVATVPTDYVRTDDTVFEVGAQFATYFGDVDGDRKGEWIVGCYLTVKEPTAADPLSRDDRARVVVLDQDKDGVWRAVWRSPGLGYEFAAPSYNLEEVAEDLDDLSNLMLPLSLVDVDNDGSREIAYHCRSHSAAVGGLPGVYRRQPDDRWVSIAPQADRFSIRDLDGDRKLEVVTGSRRIGHGTGDDDVPRVWRWKDRQYREASSDFPRFYAELANRYGVFVRRKAESGQDFDRPAWERAIQKATLLSRPSAWRPTAVRSKG